jgi:hypothetical protein
MVMDLDLDIFLVALYVIVDDIDQGHSVFQALEHTGRA